MTTTVPNSKIKEVNNKVPDISGLGKSTEYEAKISYTEGKKTLLFLIIMNLQVTYEWCKDKTKKVSSPIWYF